MKRLASIALLLAAALPALPLPAQEATTAAAPREPRDARAAAFVEALQSMPDLQASCDGTAKFYAFLGDLYKAKTKDPAPAREAAAAAFARFAEYSAYLRNQPMAFDEVADLLAKARAQGAKDPLLDLVEVMNHCMAGHSYLLPCFKAAAMGAMCNNIRAQYGPGIPLMLAQLTVLHTATDGRFSAVDAFGRQSMATALSMEALIQDYGTVAGAAAKKAGIQQGLLDCWLFAVNDRLATDDGGINPLGEPNDPRPTMFWFMGKRFRAKHDLFWNTDWSKFNPHPDLLRGLKAAQDLKHGWEARGGGYANTITDEGGRKFEAALQDANEQVAAMEIPMGSVGARLQLQATGPACNLSYPESLSKIIAAGYGPHLTGAVNTTTFYHLQRWGGDSRRNLRTLELLLDAACACGRDDVAVPVIEMVATGVNTLQTDDGEAWDKLFRKASFREDFSTIYLRALAYLAKRPEAWARVYERYLFARHLSCLCAGGEYDPQHYVAAHRAVAADAASKTPILDPASFHARYGAGWRQAFDAMMALGDPALGEKIAALRSQDWPQDADALAGQAKAWSALLDQAKDPLTRPFVAAQAHLREQAGAFAKGKPVDLPFNGENWSMDFPADTDGALAFGPLSRAAAFMPLTLGPGHGAMIDFDIVSRVDGPELCLQFLPVEPAKAPSFGGKQSGAQAANILVIERGSITAWTMGTLKQPDGKDLRTPSRAALASVGDGEKAHVRMECWPDRTLVWVNGRLTTSHAPANPMEAMHLAFTTYAGRVLKGAPSRILGVRISPLGASPAGLSGEAAEAWAKDALARDPGHEVAWAMLAKAGRMPEPVAPEILARLRAAMPQPALEDFLKAHPVPPVKLVPAVRQGGEQWIATANSEEFDAPARAAADGNPATGWHDTWRGWSGPFPQLLRIDTAAVRPVRGIRVQKRNDFDAPPARMFFETSEDGATWTPQVWSDGWTPFKKTPNKAPAFLDIAFPATVKARFLRISFFGSNHVNGYVAVAEVAPLLEEAK